MSAATAKTHVSRAMIKLGARDRAQLVVFAYETGLVRPGWRLIRPSGGSAECLRPADDGRRAPAGTMEAMTSTALSVTGLTKRYGDRTVVDHLDIELPARRRRRASSARTAPARRRPWRCCSASSDPATGPGTVLGVVASSDPAAYLPRVGALIESPAFYPSLTGAENLRVFATVGGHDPSTIPALLEQVGLRRPRRRPLPRATRSA